MKKGRRLLAAILTMAMTVNAFPCVAFAKDYENYEIGLCEHHVEHTEECGYVEDIQGQPYQHEHAVECYSDGVLPEDGIAKEADTCTHEHDENCGYQEVISGSPCEFVCEECIENEFEDDEIDALSEDISLFSEEDKVTFDGHTYEFIRQNTTWANADQYCKDQGGHLLTITSQEEQDFITQLLYSIYQQSNTRGGSWLALIRENGVSRWTTGEEFDYTHWRPGEPNGGNTGIGYGIVNRDGYWNDGGSTWSDGIGFICEWDTSIPNFNIKLSEEAKQIIPGEEFELSVTLYDGDAVIDSTTPIPEGITALSTNPEVAVVELSEGLGTWVNGTLMLMVRGVSVGTTVIEVTLPDGGSTASCIVNVESQLAGYETKIGIFSHYDLISNMIYVDGNGYFVDTNQCTPNTAELSGKKVFFLLDNKKVINIDTLDKVSNKLEITQLSQLPAVTTYSYRNGTFTYKTFVKRIVLSNILQYENGDFSEYYDIDKIAAASDVKPITIESVYWSGGEKGLRFENLDIENETIEVRKYKEISLTATIEEDYVPVRAEETIFGDLIIESSDKIEPATFRFSVNVKTVGNPNPTDPDIPPTEQDKQLTKWERDFLGELYKAEDIAVTVNNSQNNLSKYFSKSTIEDIGRLVTYWIAVLDSDIAKKNKDISPYLKVNCKMTEGSREGHSATLLLHYNSTIDWFFAKINNTQFTLIDNRTGSVLVENGLFSFSVNSSASKFANGLQGYLKVKNGEEWKNFCKKLGTNAIKEMVGDMATISGEGYLNSMLEILKDIETIAEAARSFGGYAGKASAILKNPIEASMSSAKEFNDIGAKYVSVKCPVDVYIYNPQGQLCGAIENDKITLDTLEVFINVIGTEKTVWLNDDYSIKLVATGKGTMNYSIKEYSKGLDNRTVLFNDVPLNIGIIYEGNIPKELNIDAPRYALTSNKGDIVYADKDIKVDGNESNGDVNSNSSKPSKKSIQIEDTENGTVISDRSKASKGTTVTITATPDAGYALKDMVITDSKGNELDYTNKGDGKFTFKMPVSKVTVDAIFEKIAEEKPEVSDNPFEDVTKKDWFYGAVLNAFEKKLMNGTSENTFSPLDATTRGMVATILYNLEGKPEPEGVAPFLDVTSNMYYAKAIAWASENGIVGGYDAQSFGPDDNVTREQLAAMLYRYAKWKGCDMSVKGDLNHFTDQAKISDYARDAVAWAVGEGIIRGDDMSKMNPQNFASRAEMASVFTRFNEKITK